MDIIVLRLFCELVWCQWFVVRAFQSISLMSTANSWCERGQLTRVTRRSRLPCSHQHWRWMCFDASIHIQLRVIWGHCRTISTESFQVVVGGLRFADFIFCALRSRWNRNSNTLFPLQFGTVSRKFGCISSYRHLNRGNCV